MIDSHCHLADEAFAPDLEAVVARARDAGLRRALCVIAMREPDEARRARRVVEAWPDVRLAVGAHPHQAGAFTGTPEAIAGEVRQAAASLPLVRAIGEVGLDYHYDLAPRDVQRVVFAAQVALARDMALPLVVHTREAEADTRAILEAEGGGAVEGVLHCFTGTLDMARWAVDAGWYVSLAGIVTFPRAEALREVATALPLDRLLVETDSPYLAPVPFRGKRNEPAWVRRVVEVVAQVKGLGDAEVSAAVAANFERLFRP